MTERIEKVNKLVKGLTANFLNRESTSASLISVTDVSVSPDLKKAKILLSVLPESQEKTALLFAKRKLGEMRDYLKQNMETKHVPFLEVEIDKGEKNRQKIDELLREK
ncbi:MAG: ribosome-binding factor A [Candidatus Nomurabacteria bacterium]|nr:ribosome-binding factor A [Candidatus Nomurabacteria bacterium]